MFQKTFAMKRTNIFSKYMYKVPWVKMLILGKLQGGWYLFEILHCLFTVRIKKVDFSKIVCDEACNLFFEMKEKCKVSCVR